MTGIAEHPPETLDMPAFMRAVARRAILDVLLLLADPSSPVATDDPNGASPDSPVKIEAMTPADIGGWVSTEDFRDRCEAMHRRLEAGEVMSFEAVSHGIGLPFRRLAEVVAAIVSSRVPGARITIDDTRGTLQ